MSPNGLLYRVGIDGTAGGWNAPCRTDGSFCYIPIADGQPGGRGEHFDHTYEEFSPFVTSMGATCPPGLSGVCHLDPDFAHLTYGDAGSRAQRIREFIVPGSFIVFWAGLRWLDGPQQGGLVCSIIGFYRVSQVLQAADISILDAHRNAHTRRADPGDDHLVVLADPRESGPVAAAHSDRRAPQRGPAGVPGVARKVGWAKAEVRGVAAGRVHPAEREPTHPQRS
jgi:hypothetical protein